MSLADAIKTERKKRKRGDTTVRVTEVYESSRGLVSGVKYLHDSYIVHRDIKPQNVLLLRRANGDDEKNDWAKNYVAKLSDMGLGKQLRQQRSSWRGGGTVGTAGWQAPEVLRAMLDEEDDVRTEAREENRVQQISSIVWVVLWMCGVWMCSAHASVFRSTSVRKVVKERRNFGTSFRAPCSILQRFPSFVL